jgi:hypothetical protein
MAVIAGIIRRNLRNASMIGDQTDGLAKLAFGTAPTVTAPNDDSI